MPSAEARSTPAAAAPRKPFYRILYVQVLIGIAIGVLIGELWPDVAVDMKPLGDGFIKLIKMVISLIVFCTVVTGIAGMNDMKKVGRVGAKALIYFEVVSTLALAIGLIVVNLTRPGAGIDISRASGDISKFTQPGAQLGFVEILMHVVPSSIIGAFANGEILQIVFFSLMFGIALLAVGDAGKPILTGIERLSVVFFRLTAMIIFTRLMNVSPTGLSDFPVPGATTPSRIPMLIATRTWTVRFCRSLIRTERWPI